jgi:DNA mismatch repair ATPase MutL
MAHTAKGLSDLIRVYKEEDYLVVEHEDYGHVVELHAEDYQYHKEILRDALEALSQGDLPPW